MAPAARPLAKGREALAAGFGRPELSTTGLGSRPCNEAQPHGPTSRMTIAALAPRDRSGLSGAVVGMMVPWRRQESKKTALETRLLRRCGAAGS